MSQAPLIASILAHQGGWDEILLVVGPLLIVGLALWVANKRATAQLEAQQDRSQERVPDRD
ncbi:MAG: hypothetical protein AAF467_01690 [Actinomycetota bacterium]